MDKKSVVVKVKQNLIFKKMEQEILSKVLESPEKLPVALTDLQKEFSVSPELLGDFIQEILLNKNKIHKKNPEYKKIIIDFAKENKILGLHF